MQGRGGCKGDLVCLSRSRGWRLWGGGCAQLSSANRVRMALNPQQDETEAVCLWALGSSDSLYLIFLRGLSNPGSGIWLPRVAPRGSTLGIGVRGGEQRVTIMYSVNESFFFFKVKEKLCGWGEARVFGVGGAVCFRISKSRSCPFSRHVRFTHPVATETQRRGSDSSQLLSVLSRQLSPG